MVHVHATIAVPLAILALAAEPAAAGITQGNIVIELEPVATGLIAPIGVTHAGDGSGRLFIVDQTGVILILQGGLVLPTPFLDISDRLPDLGQVFDERGLLGLAFHPDYECNGRFFVRYSAPREGAPDEPCSDPDGFVPGCHSEVLAEFRVSAGDPNAADPDSEVILFSVDEPQFNHNSGEVAFGPDGFLYFTLGDGGGAHDGLADDPPSHGPIGNGQNIFTALGSMIRIDVDVEDGDSDSDGDSDCDSDDGDGDESNLRGFTGPSMLDGLVRKALVMADMAAEDDDGGSGGGGDPPPLFQVPPDNPFVDGPGLDIIYAYGFRNPFKFSFDDGPGGDGKLIVADVGQNLFEEIDVVVNGGNYGWVIREGFHCFDPFNPTNPPAKCATTGMMGEPLLDPIADYSHQEGGISVIGGFVYRGTASPALVGRYVFGDFSAMFFNPTGRLYYLESPVPGAQIQEFRITFDDVPYGLFLKGFGEDEAGEVYACGSTVLGPNGSGGVVERIVAVTPILEFEAGLTGKQENPPVVTGASASALFTLAADLSSLDYFVQLDGLDLDGNQTADPTDNVMSMHIHNAPAGVNGPVIFGMINPAHDADDIMIDPVAGTVSGRWEDTDPANGTLSAFLAELQAGALYINVHTPAHPGGEIRGQILEAVMGPPPAGDDDDGGDDDDSGGDDDDGRDD